MYQPLTQPQGMGTILDNGTRLLIAGIKPVVMIMLLMIAVEGILFAQYGAGLTKISEQIQKGQIANIQYSDLLSFIIPFMLAYFLFTNAMIAVYAAVANARQITLREAFTIALRKLLPVLAYGIMYNLILSVTTLPAFILLLMFKSFGILAVLLGLLATLLPAILSMTLYFGNYLIIIDNAGVIESFKRSHNLVRGTLVRTGLYLSLIVIIQFISILLLPVVIALIIPYIHDLKMRKEDGSRLAA